MIKKLKNWYYQKFKMVSVKGKGVIELGYFLTPPYIPIQSYSMHPNKFIRRRENRKYKKQFRKELKEAQGKYPQTRIYFSDEALKRDKEKGEI